MFFRRISFRIGFWYALAFVFSALLLFVLTAFLLTHSLQQKDRLLLKEKAQEYSALFSRDGVRGLQLKVSGQEIEGAQSFVVRLADQNGKTLFIHSPNRSHDEDALTLEELDSALQSKLSGQAWFVIEGGGFGDHVEFVSEVLPSGEILQVGKDTEDREAFFQSFTHSYLMGIFPIFILAIVIGMFLSYRLLKPIRTLTQTVEKIRAGDPKARVHLHSNKDELWHLGSLFNQMLEQSERLIQGMKEALDNVAHDIRTPIMRLQNSVEGALQGSKTEVDYKDALVDCKDNSEIILKLIDGIMDVSEADAGTLRLKKESLESQNLIDGVIDLYGFVAEDKNISLVSRESEKFNFIGDRMRVLQAISNLVDNAIKYSGEATTVTIESAIEDKFGVIRVRDEGVGISESERLRIWDRLYRVDSSRTSRGLGLGLSLVKAIVQAHGGTVGTESNSSGRGISFLIKFPLSI